MVMTQNVNNRGGLPPKIFEILDLEIKFSGELLNVILEEKEALVKMDLAALVSLSRRKENQLKRLQLLDESLQALMKKTMNSPEAEGIKISALKSLAGSREEAGKLDRYRDRLTSLRQEILDRNLFNKKFAADTLGYLGDAISMITGAIHDPSLYGASGRARSSSNGPTIIRREV